MARTNVRSKCTLTTHEGAPAKRINAEQQLRRSVMACMLYESEFYEDGESIAARIAAMIQNVKPETVAALAIEAREKMKLRHVPLLLVREMARLPSHKYLVAETLERVIQRADELSEFVALYMKDKRQPLSAQVKRGLAAAFKKFKQYDLAKYDRPDAAIKLRDVLFLSHAKPAATPGITNVRYSDAINKPHYRRGMTLRHIEGQGATWKQLIDGTLPIPDTWETALSSGADKRETWERLLKEHKIGALATLRNLRNMREAKVTLDIIRAHLATVLVDRVLPFRFIAAARYVPELEPELEQAMFRCVAGLPRLPGKTALQVDVSGSMDAPISAKSEMRRMDAACGLAVLARELCEQVDVFSFSDHTVHIPARRGFALRDAIVSSQESGGTFLGRAVTAINDNPRNDYDRLIVFTDEQCHDPVPNPQPPMRGYIVNVASAQNGVGYGAWTHLDGFSEAVLDYIREIETTEEAHSRL